MKKHIQIFAFFFPFVMLFTKVSSQENRLQQYIDSALKNNIALQQKSISIEKAMYSLKTAKSLFQPTLAVQGSYQTGEGGRSISFPVGDLLNPVYSTLRLFATSTSWACYCWWSCCYSNYFSKELVWSLYDSPFIYYPWLRRHGTQFVFKACLKFERIELSTSCSCKRRKHSKSWEKFARSRARWTN